MSEAIAFFCGLIAMATVWFGQDTKYNPYGRGYAEGWNDGFQEAIKEIRRGMEDFLNESEEIINKYEG